MPNKQIDLEFVQYLVYTIKEKDRHIVELEHRLMKIQEILQKAKQPTKVLHLSWNYVEVVELSKFNGMLAWWLAK